MVSQTMIGHLTITKVAFDLAFEMNSLNVDSKLCTGRMSLDTGWALESSIDSSMTIIQM